MTQPRLVGSRYELGELIGYGGMAEVHRGRDTRLNREVAIKVLRADLARDPSFLTRFRREAHSAAGLNHPSIVSVYDTGEDVAADGTAIPFIVMEYVEGRTLRDILKSEGALPARRAMEIAADICAALDFSHRNGIVHRDIKPANVMITPTGAVKVMDFGIARAVADTSATVTQTANVIGTAQYLSPEQARGEAVDARSDVYSTGCLLYELVTGVPPFQGDSPVAVAYQHVRENPVLPSARTAGLPRAVDSIVMKALAKNQLNRYQTAGDMRSDLQRAIADQRVLAETVMTDDERTQFIARTAPPAIVRGDPADDHSNRRTGLIWAAVVVALLVVIGVGAYAIVAYGGGGETKTYAVPSLVGQSASAATQAIQDAMLNPVEGPVTSGPCDNGQQPAKGLVCTVTPAPGSKEKANATVTFRLYTPQLVEVPYVEGKQLSDAATTLINDKLGYTVHDILNSAAKGTVLHQHTPQFTNVLPGTKVELDVSEGLLKLPDVKGKVYEVAQAILSRAQFPNIAPGAPVTTTDLKKEGKVATESPTAGGTYDPSQTITLGVYRYVAPPPTCTSTPPAGSGSGSSTSPGASGSPSGSGSDTASSGSSSSAPSGSPTLPLCSSVSGSGSSSPPSSPSPSP